MLSSLLPGGGAPRISALEAARLLKEGKAVLVDVREPGEWASGVASPAYLLSLGDLRGARKQWKPFLDKLGGRQIIVYCASGMRSGMAAGQLRSEGFEAANLGGFGEWAGAGLPTKRG